MSPYFRKTYQRSFGTFPLKGDDAKAAINAALEVGYRGFDTAQMYQNEADVGEALAASGLAREDYFITTKVHPDNFDAAKFMPSVRESLDKLKVDRADVLLLHWPPVGGDVAPSLDLLAEAREQGLAKDVGVSNYNSRMMREAAARVPGLATNQVEFHPLIDQSVLLATAAEVGIPLASYCSVARGEIFNHPVFAEIGAAYEKTAAQIALRWILQKGVSFNAMSTKPANIHDNFNVMDFTLSCVDMARIDAMNATGLRIVDVNKVPWAPDWD